jgi:hypothetical protein
LRSVLYRLPGLLARPILIPGEEALRAGIRLDGAADLFAKGEQEKKPGKLAIP